jgi:hypothetical protein
MQVMIDCNTQQYSYRCCCGLRYLVWILQLSSHESILALHDWAVFNRIVFVRTFGHALDHRITIGTYEIRDRISRTGHSVRTSVLIFIRRQGHAMKCGLQIVFS